MNGFMTLGIILGTFLAIVFVTEFVFDIDKRKKRK